MFQFHTLFSYVTSINIKIASCRKIIQDDILSELYANKFPDVYVHMSDTESFDSGGIATSSGRDESAESEASDHTDEEKDVWCKTDKISSDEPFLGTIDLNVCIDYHKYV